MYPRRPRRVASEHGRVATCCDRLNNRPISNMGSAPASGRLTRSARRHGGTESGFEVGLRAVSPTLRPLGKGLFTTEHTETPFGRHGRGRGRCASHDSTTFPSHTLDLLDSIGGPARDVPAPPSARGVRTREGRNLLRPTEQQAHLQHGECPSLRPINTERAEARGHGEWF